jgi:hypothetical protein
MAKKKVTNDGDNDPHTPPKSVRKIGVLRRSVTQAIDACNLASDRNEAMPIRRLDKSILECREALKEANKWLDDIQLDFDAPG